jgi:hypothetical protein
MPRVDEAEGRREGRRRRRGSSMARRKKEDATRMALLQIGLCDCDRKIG